MQSEISQTSKDTSPTTAATGGAWKSRQQTAGRWGLGVSVWEGKRSQTDLGNERTSHHTAAHLKMARKVNFTQCVLCHH